MNTIVYYFSLTLGAHMKTLEQVNNLLNQLEIYVAQGHPYLTSNIPRADVTEVVALVRAQQEEIDQLKKEKACSTT